MKTLSSIQTKDRIAQAIRDEILAGNVEPGEELAQESLAQMLGVSRMPVREALQTLVQEGFAQRMPNRHIQAVVLDGRQIHEVFQMAAAMETELALMAVWQESQSQGGSSKKECTMDGLLACLSRMEAAVDTEPFIVLELEFHERILNGAENPYLRQLQKKIMDGYVVYAIRNMGEKKKVYQILSKLAEDIQNREYESVRCRFQEYYQMYADEMAGRCNQ